MPDDLQTWRRVRETVAWADAGPATNRPTITGPTITGPTVTGPISGRRDGIVDFVDTVYRARDVLRADRLLAGLACARADASEGAELAFALVASWQRVVLGTPAAAFRSGPAFAKGGRER